MNAYRKALALPERKRKGKEVSACVSQATWCPLWRCWSARTVYSPSRRSHRWRAPWHPPPRRPPPPSRRRRTRAAPRTAPPRYRQRGIGSWPRLTPAPVTCPLSSSRPTRACTPTGPATPIGKPVPMTPATRPVTPSDPTRVTSGRILSRSPFMVGNAIAFVTEFRAG